MMLMCLWLPHFTSAATFTCVPSISKTCKIIPSGDPNLLFSVADLDGDGYDDVIIRPKTSTISSSDNTQVLLSNGKTSFREYLSKALNGENTVLTIGDFDGDGKEDLLHREVTPIQGQIIAEIRSYKSGGEFTVTAISGDSDLRADLTNAIKGDFNGDGKTDFIRQEKGWWDDDMLNTAYVYLSTGTGSFTRKDLYVNNDVRSNLPGDHSNIIVGDFNGDGKDDFIRQKKDTGDSTQVPSGVLFISNGDGTFTIKDLPESLNLRGDLSNLVVGDFNGDCKADFIRQSICKPTSKVQGSWTDWKSFTPQTQAGVLGSGTGTLMMNNVPVTVTFQGSVSGNSVTNDPATSDFTKYTATYVNGPTTGDLVALAGVQSDFSGGKKVTQKITFSQPVTNPRLAIWSAGTPSSPLQYDFGSVPVTIISTGPNSYTSNPVTLTIPSGSIVEGKEGNGIIELTGTFTEITFTITYENWHAITVGIASTALVPCNDPSTLNLGTATGDFFTAALPASFNIEGLYTTLYVGDFNCDNIDDFIKQENGDRPSSTEDDITVFLSNLTPASGTGSPFTKKAQSEVFEDVSALIPGADQQSPIYLGDFNGDGRDDYIQYFGGDCFAVIHALPGKCVNKANQCKKSLPLPL